MQLWIGNVAVKTGRSNMIDQLMNNNAMIRHGNPITTLNTDNKYQKEQNKSIRLIKEAF